ncbi:E3 ubiquitin-protein ligase RNF125 [Drosophila bipectinata]|uniref:E3 ubiquitin-protein ligase RNF125 n=1 Tax=Drosophila bipectinata TaxID=42026 RepID=UPI001C89BE8E|nr:E3 ubiquitin-protein ligase RNF125 [Drosophila bipectinata]
MAGNSDCSVCLCRMRHRVRTPCNHFFCRRCLRKVYDSKPLNRCPLCRAPFEYYIRERGTCVKIVFFS